MDRKYLLKSAFNVASLTRLFAKIIDMFIVLILSVLFYPLGLILSIIYLCIADALQGGQSVGKKLMGFAVISLEDGKACSVRQSFVRNLPLIVPLFFAIVPLWGWIISALLGVPFILFEIYLIYKIDSGHRLGDVMADTSVMANDGQSDQIKSAKKDWFTEA